MKKSFGYSCQPSVFTLENLYYPQGLGYIADDPDFQIDRQSFPDYLIMCCLSGKLFIRQYDKRDVLEAGMSCILKLEDRHCYYSDKANPCEILWLHFGGKQAKTIIDVIYDGRKDFPVFSCREISAYMRQCISVYENNDLNASIEMSALIYKIMLAILEVTSLKYIENAANTTPLIKKVEYFITSNSDGRITLEELSNYCHLNKSYFCRKFHEEAGVPPMKYLLDKKIQKAKYYLVYTNEKIAAISKALRFYDQNHFSYTFYKQTGFYPSDFRMANRDNNFR